MAYPTFLLALALAVCAAQPALSASTGGGQPDFNQLIKEFQTSIDKSLSEARKNLNLSENPNGAEIVKAIREQTNKAEKSLIDMRGKLEETIKKNPEISDALDKLKKKIDEATEKLKKENPDVAANAQKAIDEFRDAYESVGKEMEKVNAEVNKKGGLRDDLDNLLKNLIDRGTAAAKDFGAKVQEVVKEVTEKKA